MASPVPTSAPPAVTFDEYRAANLDFVACIESHGGTVKVKEIDNFGVPDLSNTVTGPRLESEPGTPEYDAEIAAIQQWQDECDAATVGPVRAAYQAQVAGTGEQQQTKEQRLEAALPALRECFIEAGAQLDDNSTIDEMRAFYRDAEDNAPLDNCFINLGLATDLGDGFYEIDF